MRRLLSITVLAYLAVSSPRMALASLTFDFTQTGYTGGGQVTGNFSGNLEPNGTIQLGDLTSFSATWSGNSSVAGFSLGLSDLFRFTYTASTNVLSFGGFMSNQIGIFIPSVTGASGRVGNNIIGVGPSATTNQAAVVTAVPEPATLTPAVSGVLLCLGYAWRRRRRASPW